MFVFALVKDKEACIRKIFTWSCEEVIHQTIEAAAELLIFELNLLK